MAGGGRAYGHRQCAVQQRFDNLDTQPGLMMFLRKEGSATARPLLSPCIQSRLARLLRVSQWHPQVCASSAHHAIGAPATELQLPISLAHKQEPPAVLVQSARPLHLTIPAACRG